MSDEAPLSLKDPWVVRSVAVVGAIVVASVILGFMVFPLVQPNTRAASLWDAICSAAGVVRESSTEKPIEPDFKVSSAVMTADMLRGADAESIGRGPRSPINARSVMDPRVWVAPILPISRVSTQA